MTPACKPGSLTEPTGLTLYLAMFSLSEFDDPEEIVTLKEKGAFYV